jgi:hypothetical protein
MSVFGLHHILFYVRKTLSTEELDIAQANLQDIINSAKKHNAKFLYNEMLDYVSIDNHVNLLSVDEKDAAYVSMILNRPFETFICTQESCNTYETFIDPLVDSYIMATYKKLKETYLHNLIFSTSDTTIHLEDNDFKLFTSFNDSSLSISALPSISTMDDFNKYFNLYEWFYSRRNKHSIYLTDSFKKAIEKSPNINNILTSLLRGVYYPKYNLHHGATSSIHDIEAHRDNNQKVRIKKDKEASFNDTVLYRVYVLPHNKVKEGKIRLGYVIYKEVYIIFCYHTDHCDNMTGFKNKKFTLNGTDYTLSIVKPT